MSRAPSTADAGHSIMRPLKELYLSIFVLFYGMSGWEGRLKASTASMCLSVLVGILVVALWACVQTSAHQYIALSRWIVGGTFAVVFVVNDYFLAVRGHGIAFEKRFRSFSKNKRTALYLAAIGIVVATGVTFFLSVGAYHQAFNLPRK